MPLATVLGGVLLLRFWMQAIRVRPPASVAQFTFTLSDWLVRPLRRLVPGVGGYDWASLIGAFLVVLLATSVMFLAGINGPDRAPDGAVPLHELDPVRLHGLLVIEAMFSWVNPHAPLAPLRARPERPAAAPLAPRRAAARRP
jgi:YggT family protein